MVPHGLMEIPMQAAVVGLGALILQPPRLAALAVAGTVGCQPLAVKIQLPELQILAAAAVAIFMQT
jgi:hypothetical protein